jgi:hypothetical protein
MVAQAVVSEFTGNMKLIPVTYGNIYGTVYKRYYGGGKEDPVRTDKSKPMVIGANGFQC